MKSYWRISGLGLLLSLMLGCGGGTTGTSPIGGGGTQTSSVEKVVQGRVSRSLTVPASSSEAGVSVRDPVSGAHTVSDSRGYFSLAVKAIDGTAELEFQAGNERAAIQIENLTPRVSIINADVSLVEKALGNVLELSISKIDGEGCSGAFAEPLVIPFAFNTAPLLIINQQRSLEPTVSCLIHFELSRNARPASGVGAVLQYVVPDEENCCGQVKTSAIASASSDRNGRGSLQFFPAQNSKGYFILEVPTSVSRAERIGVIINPLVGEF